MKMKLMPHFLFLVLFLLVPIAKAESLKTSVDRLNGLVAASQKSETDARLLKALSIIDRMDGDKKWREARKLVDMEEFKGSQYYDDLVYLLFCHAANEKNISDMKYLGNRIDPYGFHGLAVLLTTTLATQDIKLLGYNSESSRLILDSVEMFPVANQIHGPMTSGNALFGFKVPEDYTHALPKVFTVKQYLDAVRPLSGFMDSNSYKTLLEKGEETGPFSPARVEKLARLYEKEGAARKAGEEYRKMAAYHKRQGQPEIAAGYIRKAAKLNPIDSEINQLKQEIELSLVLAAKSSPVTTQAPPVPPAPAQQPAAQALTQANEQSGNGGRCDDSYFFPAEHRLAAADLAGKSKKDLRLMRNEIYARHGRIFTSQDLKEFFERKCWYAPNAAYGEGFLSSVDQQNVATLKSAEGQ